ncbi:VOC family protein [Actinomadura logoneensis]|uniref:VOC family protein n=1 Tax=Actinomadura logoneensis TaxID=2293572 RepID=UPI0022A7AECD|nr:VOC family protein [Actinomadura logoneensis]
MRGGDGPGTGRGRPRCRAGPSPGGREGPRRGRSRSRRCAPTPGRAGGRGRRGRPAWPGPAEQAHLDFNVTDVEAVVDELVRLGAGRPDLQPGDGQWVVLTDPAGHPFCVAS